VLPRALRAGTSGSVTIVGTGLGLGVGAKPGLVSFGAGTVASNVQRDAHTIRAQVKVAAEAAPGLRAVSTGGAVPAAGAGQFAVYRQIDQLDVVPAYAIARVGGGRLAPVSAQFEAIASTRLPNGELLALGPVTADWTSAPFDAEAKRTEDEKFAGHFDKRGRFLPGGAGPNAQREYSGDNVGNLSVVAQAQDGDHAVEGRGHLIVTVQRWNTPPIY
jgi:quinohemoprotein amine dehydrogenase